jgi:hypothetical protein
VEHGHRIRARPAQREAPRLGPARRRQPLESPGHDQVGRQSRERQPSDGRCVP